MKIELIRLGENKHSIESLLLLNGMKQCDATESKLVCLPAGTYPVALRRCPRAGGLVPLICAEEEVAEAAATEAANAPSENLKSFESSAPSESSKPSAPSAPSENSVLSASSPLSENSENSESPAPLLPTPAMCCRCKAVADARRAIVDDELSALEFALAEGMDAQRLSCYERQLARQRRRRLAATCLPVCPRLCSGGGIYGLGNGNADGGILLGTYQLPGMVTRSREAYLRLLAALRYAAKKGDPISLTIGNLR